MTVAIDIIIGAVGKTPPLILQMPSLRQICCLLFAFDLAYSMEEHETVLVSRRSMKATIVDIK